MIKRKRHIAGVLAGVIALFTVAHARADLSGFGTFSAVNQSSGNTGTNNGVTIGYSTDNSTFTLTNSVNNEDTSGYASTAQSIATGFTTQFTYTSLPQLYNGGPSTVAADGFVFTLQNQGSTALGNGGGQLGYSGITSSAGLAFNNFGGYLAFAGSYGFNGTVASGTNPTTGNNLSNNVSVGGGDPITVKLKYVASTGLVQETFHDTVTNSTLTTYENVGTLSTTLGSSTALVGFTGSTGGFNSTQTISKFAFQAGAPSALYTPIAVSGYNEAVIVPATVTGQSQAAILATLTATQDNGTNISSTSTGTTWYEKGFNTSSPTTGLPTLGTTFASAADPSHSYQLHRAQFSNGALVAGQGDSIQLDTTHTTGTFTLATPTAFTSLSILSATANAGDSVDVKLTYSNGSTVDLGNLKTIDWFTATGAAYQADGRYNPASSSFQTFGSQPDLEAQDLDLTDTTDKVASVTFTYSGTNSGVEDSVFGISGVVSAPEPTSALLLGLAGGLPLLSCRRRRPSSR